MNTSSERLVKTEQVPHISYKVSELNKSLNKSTIFNRIPSLADG